MAIYVALDQTSKRFTMPHFLYQFNIYLGSLVTVALDELEELCNRSTHTPSRTDNNSIENIEKICGTPVSFEHWNHFETEVPRTRSVQSDTYDIDKSFIEDSGINSPSTSKMTRQHSDFESWAVVDSDANEVEFRHSTPVRHSISQRASIKPEIGIGQINYVRPPSRKLSDLKVVPSSGWQKSLIIMIPLRLGGETMNPIYVESLKTLFSLDYFIGDHFKHFNHFFSDCCVAKSLLFAGIMGGKQKRSVYFVGWHGE